MLLQQLLLFLFGNPAEYRLPSGKLKFRHDNLRIRIVFRQVTWSFYLTKR